MLLDPYDCRQANRPPDPVPYDGNIPVAILFDPLLRAAWERHRAEQRQARLTAPTEGVL